MKVTAILSRFILLCVYFINKGNSQQSPLSFLCKPLYDLGMSKYLYIYLVVYVKLICLQLNAILANPAMLCWKSVCRLRRICTVMKPIHADVSPTIQVSVKQSFIISQLNHLDFSLFLVFFLSTNWTTYMHKRAQTNWTMLTQRRMHTPWSIHILHTGSLL